MLKKGIVLVSLALYGVLFFHTHPKDAGQLHESHFCCALCAVSQRTFDHLYFSHEGVYPSKNFIRISIISEDKNSETAASYLAAFPRAPPL